MLTKALLSNCREKYEMGALYVFSHGRIFRMDGNTHKEMLMRDYKKKCLNWIYMNMQ